MSLGDEPHNWFFEPGDMVGDRAAVHEIFKVPDGAEVIAKTDKIVMRPHDKCSADLPAASFGRTQNERPLGSGR